MKNNIFWIFILFLIGVLLFFGGLGVEVEMVQYVGALVGVLLVILTWLLKRKVHFPPFIILYSLFLILFLINSFVISVDTKKSLEVFSLFLGGGLFWLAFYNLRKEFRPTFDKLIVLLGIVFGILFIYSHYFGEAQAKPWSLYLPYSAYLNHNNIGDLWSVVLTIVVFYILKKPKNYFVWFLVPLGIYLLAMSQSRAAYVAFAVGVIYLGQAGGWLEKYKKIFILFIFTAAALFLFTGFYKTTLFTRQYYLQGILGFFHNPQGVGVGNFGVISSDPENILWGLSHFSSNAHNIVLEIMTGMGVLGLIFVAWFVLMVVELWNDKGKKNLVYKAVFFALTANFFFHSSYFIPAMFWMWFICLGIAQSSR